MTKIAVTLLDGTTKLLDRDQVGTIIGDSEQDREDFLSDEAGAGIYLMSGSSSDWMDWGRTGELLQVKETPDAIVARLSTERVR